MGHVSATERVKEKAVKIRGKKTSSPTKAAKANKKADKVVTNAEQAVAFTEQLREYFNVPKVHFVFAVHHTTSAKKLIELWPSAETAANPELGNVFIISLDDKKNFDTDKARHPFGPPLKILPRKR
eukprot:PhM_4_TR16779/c4_g6_i4/m.22827